MNNHKKDETCQRCKKNYKKMESVIRGQLPHLTEFAYSQNPIEHCWSFCIDEVDAALAQEM